MFGLLPSCAPRKPLMCSGISVIVALERAATSGARAAVYDQAQTNTHVGQSTSFYCGSASALMTLNTGSRVPGTVFNR